MINNLQNLKKSQTFLLALAITAVIMAAAFICLPKPQKPVTVEKVETPPILAFVQPNDPDDEVIVKPPSKVNQPLEVKLTWKLDSYEDFYNEEIDDEDCKNVISLYWDRIKLGSLITLDSDEKGTYTGVVLGLNNAEYMMFEPARRKLQDYAVKYVKHSLTRGERTKKHTIAFVSLNPDLIPIEQPVPPDIDQPPTQDETLLAQEELTD